MTDPARRADHDVDGTPGLAEVDARRLAAREPLVDVDPLGQPAPVLLVVGVHLVAHVQPAHALTDGDDGSGQVEQRTNGNRRRAINRRFPSIICRSIGVDRRRTDLDLHLARAEAS